jgi:apolipoprotein N-acyltransferase
LYVALAGGVGGTATWRAVSAGRGLRLGLLAGIVHFGGTIYWTSGTVATYGDLPWMVAIPVTGLLVMYMALFVALAAAASAVMIRGLGLPGLLLAPSAWVSAEYVRGHLFGGFPWIPLGNAVVTLLPIAQLASVAGVYGVSWLLATINACFAAAALGTGRMRTAAAVAGLALVTAPSIWGAGRLFDGRLTREGTPVTIGLVQGNVPQHEKWDPARARGIVDRYLRMTREAAAAGARFIIWPESATPFYFDEDPFGAAEIRQTVREAGAPLLFGTDEVERGAPDRYYNSAFMLDAAGATSAVYRKMFLVPFGEYVPFEAVLTFVRPLVESVSSFSPGRQITMLPVGGHMVSAAICYEVVYPHLMRDGVRLGSELLTTITNDAWYGESSAPFQHFELAAMRAIEQGRYLARAANTGISGIVDPYGRIVARTGLFETRVVVGEARFLRQPTVYATIGDLAAGLAVLLTLAGMGVALRRRRGRA